VFFWREFVWILFLDLSVVTARKTKIVKMNTYLTFERLTGRLCSSGQLSNLICLATVSGVRRHLVSAAMILFLSSDGGCLDCEHLQVRIPLVD
jgi:hypothetical protein